MASQIVFRTFSSYFADGILIDGFHNLIRMKIDSRFVLIVINFFCNNFLSCIIHAVIKLVILEMGVF